MGLTTKLALVLGLFAAAALAGSSEGRAEAVQETKEEAGEDIVKEIGGRKTSQEEAFEIDCGIAAKKFGWGLDATRRHMKNQKTFGELVLFLETKHDDVFAASAMARNPGEEATIWIKGPFDEGLAKEVANFQENLNGMKVSVVFGSKFSAREQEERMDRLDEHLAAKGFASVGSTVRPGDVIFVSLEATDRFPPSEPPKVPLELGQGGDSIDPVLWKHEDLIPEGMEPAGIHFAFTREEINVDKHARGGRMVYGSSGQCTSGFSVWRVSDGMNGITTAAHCTGMSTFDAESPEADFALYHKGEHCGSHGDVEWKSSSHVELPEYWAGPGDRRDVTSVELSFSVNNVYCVHSRMQSERNCDRVYSTSVSQKGSLGYCKGRTSKRLVAMDDGDNSIAGDSGGPWSWYTQAVGIVKGSKWIWFGTRDTFTKASRFDEALGLGIKRV